jgi:16S rRNA G966 N2-methylase RsmD
MAYKRPQQSRAPRAAAPTTLRIIGGTLRGRKFIYNGDPGTRPMKDRVREAVFNLVGPAVVGTHAIDLFAGTGALGLEALSRGAAQATFIERHRPTAKTLQDNIAALGVASQAGLVTSDTFYWARRLPDSLREAAGDGSASPISYTSASQPTISSVAGARNSPPWLVFCSPPYALYQQRRGELLELIAHCMNHAPPESMVVVEADTRFDFTQLADEHNWDVREYPPAVIGLWRKPADSAEAN